jgi:glutamate N-acetyltransferase/amino-acid N-acetyltransferase
MATMLAFITTDAKLDNRLLQKHLKAAVANSFNLISVDGDASTNDSVTILANGQANVEIRANSTAEAAFSEALHRVCEHLARAIVADGEGATKFITLKINNAPNYKGARKIFTSVATSSLVRTACFGSDPNWGRIVCAVGYAGVKIKPEWVSLKIQGTTVFKNMTKTDFNKSALAKAMRQKNIEIELDLNQGPVNIEGYFSDLSYDYVKINAEYTT